jgi:hypothetical protein
MTFEGAPPAPAGATAALVRSVRGNQGLVAMNKAVWHQVTGGRVTKIAIKSPGAKFMTASVILLGTPSAALWQKLELLIAGSDKVYRVPGAVAATANLTPWQTPRVGGDLLVIEVFAPDEVTALQLGALSLSVSSVGHGQTIVQAAKPVAAPAPSAKGK